jgi:UDP-N-acetyl-D-glucosamine dehydrogenase
VIELFQQRGAQVFYNDPYFAYVGRGRKYDLQMTNTPLTDLGQYDAVVIVTDHSDYDYERIVKESRLVIDTRNATKGLEAGNIVRC